MANFSQAWLRYVQLQPISRPYFADLDPFFYITDLTWKRQVASTVKMAPANLPSVFNATSQDIEMLLAAQAHLGSKNLQVHMEPYLWKTRQDGVNVINVGKTW